MCTDSSHRHHLIDGALPAFAFAHFVGNVTRCVGIAGTEKLEKRSVFRHVGNTTGANNTALPHYIREMSTSDFYPTGYHTQWMEVECDIFSPP